MKHYVPRLLIVLTSLANSSYTMERFAKLFSCVNPHYQRVDSTKKSKLDEWNDLEDCIYIIHLSGQPAQVTIPRFVDPCINHRWTAAYTSPLDQQVIEIKPPVDKFSNNTLVSQHFDIVGKKPGKVTLILSEIKQGKTVRNISVPITVVSN